MYKTFKNSFFIFALSALTALSTGCDTGGGTPKDSTPSSIINDEIISKNSTLNSTPVATFNNFTINKDARYDGQLTATDADGDELKYIIITQPLHGTVVLHDNGCFTYTPNEGYKGTDRFSYRASDDLSSCAVKTVTVNVAQTPVKLPNAPTTLKVEAISTTKLQLTWIDNSSDEEGFVIYKDGKPICTTKANVTHFTVSCGLNAGTTYNFEVKAKNAAGTSTAAIATGTTKDITTSPTAPTNLKTKAVDKTSLRLSWRDNSNNESSFEIYQDGVKVKTVSAGCTCAVITGLTACERYEFIVKAVNKIGSSNSNTITVETLCDVVPTNHAPIPTYTNFTMDEDTTKQDTLTATDADGDALTFAKVSNPTHGTLSINENGNFTYVPTENYNGSDSFSYSVSDSTMSVTQTVTITITDVAEPDTTPPVIILEGVNPITLTVGDTYTELGATANDDRDGVVDVSVSGSVDTTTAGTYTVTYTAVDSSGNSSQISRSVIVEQAGPTFRTIPNKTIGDQGGIDFEYDVSQFLENGGTGGTYSVTGPDASAIEQIEDGIFIDANSGVLSGYVDANQDYPNYDGDSNDYTISITYTKDGVSTTSNEFVISIEDEY